MKISLVRLSTKDLSTLAQRMISILLFQKIFILKLAKYFF